VPLISGLIVICFRVFFIDFFFFFFFFFWILIGIPEEAKHIFTINVSLEALVA
jgi:hypothetical protein